MLLYILYILYVSTVASASATINNTEFYSEGSTRTVQIHETKAKRQDKELEPFYCTRGTRLNNAATRQLALMP